MTRAGEKLYRDWQPDERPPVHTRFWWLVAVTTVCVMLVVSAMRGNW